MLRDPDIVAKREADKWEFLPPGGENYRQVALRVGGLVRERSTRDTVVCAHGGTGRALVALLGIAPPDAGRAPGDRSGRGLRLAPGSITRYA